MPSSLHLCPGGKSVTSVEMDFVLQSLPISSFLHSFPTKPSSPGPSSPCSIELERTVRKSLSSGRVTEDLLSLSKMGTAQLLAISATDGNYLEIVLSLHFYLRYNLGGTGQSPRKLLTNILIQKFCFNWYVRKLSMGFFFSLSSPQCAAGVENHGSGWNCNEGILVR